MQQISQCQRIRSELLSIKALNDDLIALSTQLHGIHIFSAATCEKKKVLFLEHLNYNTTAVDIHEDANICAVANNHIIYIISLLNKRVLGTIYTYNGEVNQLTFIPHTPYLISGTNRGRVMLYRYDSHYGLSRLTSFGYQQKNSYVSALAYNKSYIAASGYGGSVKLLSLYTHKVVKVFHDSQVRVNALSFVDEEQLVFGNVNGLLCIYSLNQAYERSVIQMPFSDIRQIVSFGTSDFLLVSGESHFITLVDLKNKKILRQKYLTFTSEVTTMLFSKQGELIVVLKNNQLFRVRFSTTEDIKKAIVNKDLSKAFAIIENDPRLQNTKEHTRVEALYEKLYAKTLNALIDSNKEIFTKNIAILNTIDSKSDEIKLLHEAYKNYTKFQSLYLSKRYALAYNLCDKYKALKYTPHYKKMEEHFKEQFTFAQKQILLGREDIAKEILIPYITVLSKRPLINLLLKQNREFLLFLEALEEKNYEKIEHLAQKYEIFQEIPGYSALKKSQRILLHNITKSIENAKVDEALKQLKSLPPFTCKDSEIEALYEYANIVKRFLWHYEHNEFKECYELIDSDTRLERLEVAKLLEKHWQKLMNACEVYALAGDLQSIKEQLKELLIVPTRLQRVGDLLRLSFYTKIQKLIKKNKFQSAEHMIYSYIDIFGIDAELYALMRHYEKYTERKLAITDEQGKKHSRESWIHSDIL